MQPELANAVLVPDGIENCKDLIHKVYYEIYSELINSVVNVPYESKDNRCYGIMVSAVEKTRYLVLKLIVLLKWTGNLDIIDHCQHLILNDNCNIQQLMNSMNILSAMGFRMQSSLHPIFPLNSALSVLTLGEYPFIPVVCDSKAPFISKVSMKEGQRLINRILRTRILTEPIPSYVSSIHVSDQVITCEEKNFFIVQFTNTKSTLDSTMTVTTLRIYNNNNTRMTVFPYFSSEQLSHVIFILNQLIVDDTDLKTLLSKIYSVLYFTITKQILYVLHLQLNALPAAQKSTYGLSDFSYNIDTDTLSLSFWKKFPSKREYTETDTNTIVLHREEDPETHLMKIVGKSNDYSFTVDLIDYRIFDIILTCIQYRQHTLLMEYKEYLEKELAGTHYSIHERRLHDWVSELSIHIYSTPLSLLLSINSFTGEFEVELSDPSIFHWCEPIVNEIKTLIRAKYFVIDKLDQFFVYCILYQVAYNYTQTYPDYQFVYSTYDDMPCLYLPCLVTKDLPGTSTQYKLLIRLLQNTSIGRVASCASLPSMPVPSMMQGKQAYHSVNNKLGGLSEYSPTEEIGFDIDGEELHSESDDDPIDPWMIDVIGVRHTRTHRVGNTGNTTSGGNGGNTTNRTNGTNGTNGSTNTIELLESVHRKVVCSETTINENREEINYTIDKLLPRLRYASLAATIALFKQYNMITQEQSDANRRSFQMVCKNVHLMMKVEDSMEIRVLQEANELKLFNQCFNRRGCYQPFRIHENKAEYTLMPNSSPSHLRAVLEAYSRTLVFYNSLIQSLNNKQIPFCISMKCQLSSMITAVLLYHLPNDSDLHSIAFTFPPWNAVEVHFDMDLPAVNSHLQQYIRTCLRRNRPFDRVCILQAIAAQYVYTSMWKELSQLGVEKNSNQVLLCSIGLTRMELRIRVKEQVAFYLHLGLTSVLIEPKDSFSLQFLSSILGTESKRIEKEYGSIARFISDLVKRRQQM